MFWFEQVSAREALESGRNPIVGDPGRIARLATDLTATADSLRTQNQRLRAVRSEQFWKGEAADKFVTFKEKLPPLLDKVIERYTKVSSALASYHPEISESRQLAERAIQDYQAALQDQGIARTNAQHRDLLCAQAQAQHRAFVWNGPQPERQLADATDRMQAAIREMTQALEQRDQAARACSTRIGQAIDDGLKNESWWRRALHGVGHWVLDSLEAAAPILRQVGGYLGIAALALGWVPVVGEVIVAAAAVVNVAALIADGVLYAAGRRVSASQVVVDAIGVLPLGRMVKAAGGLKAVRNVRGAGEAAQFLKAAGKAAGPELKAVFSRAGTALEALSRDGAGGVLDRTAKKLAAPGAVRTVVGHVVEERLDENAKDFLKDPAGTVSDVIRNPAGLLLPEMPSRAPARPNVLVESGAALARDAVDRAGRHPDVVRSVTRITRPLAPMPAPVLP